MPRPTATRESYADIMTYIDTVLAHGYLKITFETEGQAIHATQRMNKWRVIEREIGSYVLDSFVFSRTGRVVVIKPREVLKAVKVEDDEGNPVELTLNTGVKM